MDLETSFLEYCHLPTRFTLSWAQSLNGALTAMRGKSTALSGPESLALVHRLRAVHDGILVGIGTVLADDPRLNLRLAPGTSPRQIILDPQARTPIHARLWESARCSPLFIVAHNAKTEAVRALQDQGGEVIALPQQENGHLNWQHIDRTLGEYGLGTVLVEGGISVHTSLLNSELPLRLALTLCPQVISGAGIGFETSALSQRHFSDLGHQIYGNDLVWFMTT